MPCYFVGEVDVRDPEGYSVYAKAAAPLIEQYGGKVLAKGGATFSFEGFEPAGRIVIVEFPSAEVARAFQSSPEYQAIIPIRHRTAVARAFVVDGVV